MQLFEELKFNNVKPRLAILPKVEGLGKYVPTRISLTPFLIFGCLQSWLG